MLLLIIIELMGGFAPSLKSQSVVFDSSHSKLANSSLQIGLLFYEDCEKSIQLALKQEIETFYHCKVTLLKARPLPAFAYNPSRNRYKAEKLLLHLKAIKGEHFGKIIGITSKDIATRKGEIPDWGIFGLGYRPGPSCVVSTFRLRRRMNNRQQLLVRTTKVSLHEIGHTLGIPHCNFPDPYCFMKDAEGKLSTVDAIRKHLCSDCRKQIQ